MPSPAVGMHKSHYIFHKLTTVRSHCHTRKCDRFYSSATSHFSLNVVVMTGVVCLGVLLFRFVFLLSAPLLLPSPCMPVPLVVKIFFYLYAHIDSLDHWHLLRLTDSSFWRFTQSKNHLFLWPNFPPNSRRVLVVVVCLIQEAPGPEILISV